MDHHQIAGDTNTQNDENVTGPFTTIVWQETQIHRLMENVTGPFTTIVWQETQIHRLMRTFEFSHII